MATQIHNYRLKNPHYISFDTSKYSQEPLPRYNDNWTQYSMIKENLEALGCSNIDQVSQCMTHDMMTFKSPVSQILNDIYHSSESPSFDQFLNDKAVSHLRQDNHKLFSLFQKYSSVYNNDICLPLKQLFLSKQQSFEIKKGEKEKQMIQLSEIFQNCKDRAIHMHGTCTQQMDVLFPVKLSDERAASNIGSNNDEDDEDDKYRDLEEKHKMPLKRVIPRSDNFQDFKPNELGKNDGIDKIMRNEFKTIGKFDQFQRYSYSRNEMRFMGNSMHTLTSTDTIPKLAPEQTRLFREYHTINAIQRAAVTMGNVLCFSYHILQSCIQLFCYIFVNGEMFGQRVFTQDLVAIFNSLYPESKNLTETIDEMNKNMEINNKELKFDADQMFMRPHRNKLVFFKQNSCCLMERISLEMAIEYNVGIASKIIKVIEEDGFDDESLWDDVQEEEESLIKERMKPNEFESLLRICKQYYQTSSWDMIKVILFQRSQRKVLSEQIKSRPILGIKIDATNQLIPQFRNLIKEDFVNDESLYYYMDISVSLQLNDGQMREISLGHQQEITIINNDLHIKEENGNESLYGIVTKKYNGSWRLNEFLTGEQVVAKYKLNIAELPKSSRQSFAFQRKMMNLMITEAVIQETDWCNIVRNIGFLAASEIPSRANTLKICRHRLVQQCLKSFQDPQLPRFRILVKDDDNHWIDWIKVIRIEYSPSLTFYTAIQYGYDQKQRVLILKWLNQESPQYLSYDLQETMISFCIPIKIKSIHHDPRYLYSLHKAVGNEKSDLSFAKLSCLSPWPKQFEIGDFESEWHTLVEILNAKAHGTNIDICEINEKVKEQKLDFDYSYFLYNNIGAFRRAFSTVSHGKVRQIYNKLRGERKIVEVDKRVNYEEKWNIDSHIDYYQEINDEEMFGEYLIIS